MQKLIFQHCSTIILIKQLILKKFIIHHFNAQPMPMKGLWQSWKLPRKAKSIMKNPHEKLLGIAAMKFFYTRDSLSQRNLTRRNQTVNESSRHISAVRLRDDSVCLWDLHCEYTRWQVHVPSTLVFSLAPRYHSANDRQTYSPASIQTHLLVCRLISILTPTV